MRNNNFEKILDNLDVMMDDITIDFKYEKGQKVQIFVNDKDFTSKIRTEQGCNT